MKSKLRLRWLAGFTLITFAAGQFYSQPVLAATATEINTAAISFPSEITKIELPKNLGRIEDSFKGTSSQKVIVIQDAHAIPQAQRSIEKIIGYFQEKYGLQLIGLEGAASQLDTRMFTSFPDKETLKNVFREYYEKGELTGSVAAAIFGPQSSVFQGVENWDLYEKGLSLYLEAVNAQPELLASLEKREKELNAKKEKTYSRELLEVDRAFENFLKNSADLPGVLKLLSGYKKPAAGSELAVILDELSKKGEDVSSDIEVKKLILQFEKHLNAISSATAKEFHLKRQEFHISRISAQELALWLKEAAVKEGFALRTSGRLGVEMGKHQRLRDIEGTRFFKSFENYAESVKKGLFKNPEDTKLNKETKRQDILRKLIRLELTRGEWEQLQAAAGNPDAGIEKILGIPQSAVRAAFAFYENASARDHAFFDNLMKFTKNRKQESLLVAGGFHAYGLTERLKAEGISYSLILPEIGSVPEKISYQEQMRGNVSWKDYFEIENGRVNLYKAFVRGTRDRLLGVEARGGKGEGKNAFNPPPAAFPLTIQNARVLKYWRDEIIRNLADQKQIEKAGDYTRFLDELTSGKNSFSEDLDPIAKIDRFIDGLKNLKLTNRLTEQNIMSLAKTVTHPGLAASPDVMTPGAWASVANVPAASRSGASPLAVKAQTSRAEIRQDGETEAQVDAAAPRFEARLQRGDVTDSASYERWQEFLEREAGRWTEGIDYRKLFEDRRVLVIGDTNHEFLGVQRGLLDQLDAMHQAGVTHLALEVDSDEELANAASIAQSTYVPHRFLQIVEKAQSLGMEVLFMDMPRSEYEGPGYRDENSLKRGIYMGKIIVEKTQEIIRKNPEARLVAMTGYAHVEDAQQIPLQLEQSGIAHRKVAIVSEGQASYFMGKYMPFASLGVVAAIAGRAEPGHRNGYIDLSQEDMPVDGILHVARPALEAPSAVEMETRKPAFLNAPGTTAELAGGLITRAPQTGIQAIWDWQIPRPVSMTFPEDRIQDDVHGWAHNNEQKIVEFISQLEGISKNQMMYLAAMLFSYAANTGRHSLNGSIIHIGYVPATQTFEFVTVDTLGYRFSFAFDYGSRMVHREISLRTLQERFGFHDALVQNVRDLPRIAIAPNPARPLAAPKIIALILAAHKDPGRVGVVYSGTFGMDLSIRVYNQDVQSFGRVTGIPYIAELNLEDFSLDPAESHLYEAQQIIRGLTYGAFQLFNYSAGFGFVAYQNDIFGLGKKTFQALREMDGIAVRNDAFSFKFKEALLSARTQLRSLNPEEVEVLKDLLSQDIDKFQKAINLVESFFQLNPAIAEKNEAPKAKYPGRKTGREHLAEAKAKLARLIEIRGQFAALRIPGPQPAALTSPLQESSDRVPYVTLPGTVPVLLPASLENVPNLPVLNADGSAIKNVSQLINALIKRGMLRVSDVTRLEGTQTLRISDAIKQLKIKAIIQGPREGDSPVLVEAAVSEIANELTRLRNVNRAEARPELSVQRPVVDLSVDGDKLEAWIAAQADKGTQALFRFLASHLTYVDPPRFEKALTQSVEAFQRDFQGDYAAVLLGDMGPPTASSKSNPWVYQIARGSGLRPPVAELSAYQTYLASTTLTWLKKEENKSVNDFLYVDDAAYSGRQIQDWISLVGLALMQNEQGAFTDRSLTVHVMIPFMTTTAKNKLRAIVEKVNQGQPQERLKLKFYDQERMRTVREIFDEEGAYAEIQAEFDRLFPDQSGKPITWFYKKPDFMSIPLVGGASGKTILDGPVFDAKGKVVRYIPFIPPVENAAPYKAGYLEWGRESLAGSEWAFRIQPGALDSLRAENRQAETFKGLVVSMLILGWTLGVPESVFAQPASNISVAVKADPKFEAAVRTVYAQMQVEGILPKDEERTYLSEEQLVEIANIIAEITGSDLRRQGVKPGPRERILNLKDADRYAKVGTFQNAYLRALIQIWGGPESLRDLIQNIKKPSEYYKTNLFGDEEAFLRGYRDVIANAKKNNVLEETAINEYLNDHAEKVYTMATGMQGLNQDKLTAPFQRGDATYFVREWARKLNDYAEAQSALKRLALLQEQQGIAPGSLTLGAILDFLSLHKEFNRMVDAQAREAFFKAVDEIGKRPAADPQKKMLLSLQVTSSKNRAAEVTEGILRSSAVNTLLGDAELLQTVIEAFEQNQSAELPDFEAALKKDLDTVASQRLQNKAAAPSIPFDLLVFQIEIARGRQGVTDLVQKIKDSNGEREKIIKAFEEARLEPLDKGHLSYERDRIQNILFQMRGAPELPGAAGGKSYLQLRQELDHMLLTTRSGAVLALLKKYPKLIQNLNRFNSIAAAEFEAGNFMAEYIRLFGYPQVNGYDPGPRHMVDLLLSHPEILETEGIFARVLQMIDLHKAVVADLEVRLSTQENAFSPKTRAYLPFPAGGDAAEKRARIEDFVKMLKAADAAIRKAAAEAKAKAEEERRQKKQPKPPADKSGAAIQKIPAQGNRSEARQARGGTVSQARKKTLTYEGIITLNLGGKKTLVIGAVDDLKREFGDSLMADLDPKVQYLIVNPDNPKEANALWLNKPLLQPTRIPLPADLLRKFSIIRGPNSTITIENYGISEGIEYHFFLDWRVSAVIASFQKIKMHERELKARELIQVLPVGEGGEAPPLILGITMVAVGEVQRILETAKEQYGFDVVNLDLYNRFLDAVRARVADLAKAEDVVEGQLLEGKRKSPVPGDLATLRGELEADPNIFKLQNAIRDGNIKNLDREILEAAKEKALGMGRKIPLTARVSNPDAYKQMIQLLEGIERAVEDELLRRELEDTATSLNPIRNYPAEAVDARKLANDILLNIKAVGASAKDLDLELAFGLKTVDSEPVWLPTVRSLIAIYFKGLPPKGQTAQTYINEVLKPEISTAASRAEMREEVPGLQQFISDVMAFEKAYAEAKKQYREAQANDKEAGMEIPNWEEWRQKELFQPVLKSAEALGLDTRPIRAGILGPLFVGHAMEIRRAINPEPKPGQIAIYGAAGTDISKYLLTVGAPEAYFLEPVPVWPSKLQDALRSWTEDGSYDPNENYRQVYGAIGSGFDMRDANDFKRTSGFASSGEYNFGEKEARIMVELKGMGVRKSSVKIGEDEREITPYGKPYKVPYVEFLRAEKEGEPEKTYRIYFVPANLTAPGQYPEMIRSLEGKADYYFQEAAWDTAHDSDFYLPAISGLLKPGGMLVTDDRDVISRFGSINILEHNPEFALQKFGIQYENAQKPQGAEAWSTALLNHQREMARTPEIASNENYLRYGWDVALRRVLKPGNFAAQIPARTAWDAADAMHKVFYDKQNRDLQPRDIYHIFYEEWAKLFDRIGVNADSKVFIHEATEAAITASAVHPKKIVLSTQDPATADALITKKETFPPFKDSYGGQVEVILARGRKGFIQNTYSHAVVQSEDPKVLEKVLPTLKRKAVLLIPSTATGFLTEIAKTHQVETGRLLTVDHGKTFYQELILTRNEARFEDVLPVRSAEGMRAEKRIMETPDMRFNFLQGAVREKLASLKKTSTWETLTAELSAPSSKYKRSLPAYFEFLAQLRQRAGLKPGPVFYPFGGAAPHMPFELFQADEVVSQSGKNPTTWNDLERFLERAENALAEQFLQKYGTLDSERNISTFQQEHKTFDGAGILRLMLFLGAEITGIYGFEWSEAGMPQFIEPNGNANLENLMVTFTVTGKDGQKIEKRWWSVGDHLAMPNPGYEAFLKSVLPEAWLDRKEEQVNVLFHAAPSELFQGEDLRHDALVRSTETAQNLQKHGLKVSVLADQGLSKSGYRLSGPTPIFLRKAPVKEISLGGLDFNFGYSGNGGVVYHAWDAEHLANSQTPREQIRSFVQDPSWQTIQRIEAMLLRENHADVNETDYIWDPHLEAAVRNAVRSALGDLGEWEQEAAIAQARDAIDTFLSQREVRRQRALEERSAKEAALAKKREASSDWDWGGFDERSEMREADDAQTKAIAESVIAGNPLTLEQAGFTKNQVLSVNADAFFTALGEKAKAAAAAKRTESLGVTQTQIDASIDALISILKKKFADGNKKSLAIVIDVEGEKVNLERVLSNPDLQGLLSLVMITKRTGPLRVAGVNRQIVNGIPKKTVFSADNGDSVPALTDTEVSSPVAFGVGAINKKSGQEALDVVGLLLEMTAGLLVSDMEAVETAADVKNAQKHDLLKAELIRQLFGIAAQKTGDIRGAINFTDHGITFDYTALKIMIQYLSQQAVDKAA